MSALVSFVDLSIVVPAYNEELRLPPTLAKLHAFLERQPLRYEIVVVDDSKSSPRQADAESR
jgi:dolichyl-phosphate beta-glucosyltransferase